MYQDRAEKDSLRVLSEQEMDAVVGGQGDPTADDGPHPGGH